jgi:pilus assembly protein CpaC
MLLIDRAFRGTPVAVATIAAMASLVFSDARAQANTVQRAVPARPAPVQSNAQVLPVAPCGRVDIAPLVQIPVGKSTVIKPLKPIATILLGNPENARAARPGTVTAEKKEEKGDSPAANLRPGVADVDVLLLGPREIYLLGKTIGSTNVVMLDREGGCTAFDVVVGMDTTALQQAIDQLLPDEKSVRVSHAFDSVVLSGVVSDSEALMRVVDLANAYVGAAPGAAKNPRIVNMLQVGAPQQVMLEVKVAEIAKSLLDSFGIDFSRAYVPGDGSMVRFLSGIFGGTSAIAGQISGTGPRGVPYSSVDTVIGGSVNGVGSNGLAGSALTTGNVTSAIDQNGRIVYTTTYGTVPGRGVSNVNLNMQKNDGLVKVLAEPSVMAISGQTGSFLAGGKIFIPIAQTDNAGGRTISLEEKEFGVSVRFTPTVLGGGRINLRVRPEVSELNGTGVTIAGAGISTVLPSFTSRKAETTVQLMDGQSFAIGGLIKNNTTTNIKAFPFLGELPIIGVLFRSTEFQTDKSELVFVITPRLVKPLPADYRLPTDNYTPPSRTDLILHGRVEGDRPAEGAAPVRSPAQGGFDPGTERK